MATESEQILENQLIDNLKKLGYHYVVLADEAGVLANLKTQLEKHNNTTFSETEFEKVLNILSKGSVFEKAKVLREKQHLIREDGSNLYFEFLNVENWCQNQYQVTNQVSQEGKYHNRYDVTLLINGLPLVQIELKRRGLELKEAFNQINRYQKHSFGAGYGLFQYLQLFVISNGVNTKYYSNFGIHKAEFLQTFHWTDEDNKPYNMLINSFCDHFLEPCHLSKMICKYIVLNETEKKLMVLRPYQFYAVENILKKVETNKVFDTPHYDVKRNGYIWHTTGSGKTLTSFKASQILSTLNWVKKVVFVVDRKDLDYQTNQEYDKFSKGCVSSADNTQDLINKFNDPTIKIIVTTIQKLNNTITLRNVTKMKEVQQERMVFIFDECHRSQFGDTHKNITGFFKNVQLFGFTGTPILAENANGERTTSSLFGTCLHKYVITDAIRDENVLRFSVEYVSTFKQKNEVIDLKVEAINETEVLEAPERKAAIVDYILQHHDQKTQSKQFNAIMCVQDIDAVIQYYELFRAKALAGEHHLKVITIFSYVQNEEEMSFELIEDPNVAAEPVPLYESKPHRREKLDEYIEHFNQLFGTAYSTKDTLSFYNYYNDVSKKIKERKADILIVANMFLTGFDSKYVNTLYVDKNLKFHGLIQAFSRTNRILDKNKTQGNIVCFRNLKDKTDEAITLFSNKEAIAEVIMEPYVDYVTQFNDAVKVLQTIVPEVQNVDDLITEEDQAKFILAFRNLMRLRTKMQHFNEFTWEDLSLDEQAFTDYSSKYLDLKDSILHQENKEKASILADIDFELELIRRDTINISYIIQLLIKLKQSKENKGKDTEAIEKEIFNLLNAETTLRSKRELIDKFIQQNFVKILEAKDIEKEFELFWKIEQQHAFDTLIEEEKLSVERTRRLLENYLFAEKEPLRDEVLELIDGQKPSALQRKAVGERILAKIKAFMEIFDRD